ncbi:MAG: hypothetical protein AMXMBFR4_08910 [Candidatus Hydrogenedentota bacterium]
MQETRWIETPWRGKLAIVSRPRGGEWLESDLRALRSEGVGVLASVLADSEVADLELSVEGGLCERVGMEFRSFPIADRSIPDSFEDAREFVHLLSKALSNGIHVGIHCRQGLGRSPMIAIAVLVHGGVGLEEAIRRVADARGTEVPETYEQMNWLRRFAVEDAHVFVSESQSDQADYKIDS